jgi:predicted RNase H-like nuclease (RuvC/YqgF family)
METENSDQQPRKNSNKIYFLVAVILALLGTNAYLFFKEKKSSERIVTVSDEKSRMQTEIDKIEAELDNSNSSNIKLSEQMQKEQDLARQKIADLRIALKKGQLTQGQLAKAQEDIKQLRYFVTKYSADIEELKLQNASLTTERNTLRTTVDSVSTKATNLEKVNEELNTKVKAAAALKTGNVSIIPLRVKSSGKETDVTRATTTKKLRVNFTVVNNSIAEKGMHDIYMRIIDPSGNLIVSDNGGMFNADDEELQYTYKTAVEFGNDGKAYVIDWTNPGSFQKGTYTIVLYADGYTMGKGAVSLK